MADSPGAPLARTARCRRPRAGLGAPQEGAAVSPAPGLSRPPGSVIRTAPGAAPVVAASLPPQVRTDCSSRSRAPPMRSGAAATGPRPAPRPSQPHATKRRHAPRTRRTLQPSPSVTQAISGGLETARSRMTRVISDCRDGAATDMRPAQGRADGGQPGTRRHCGNHNKKPEAIHGRVLPPPTHSTLRPAPPVRKSHKHRGRETGTTGARPALVRSMGAGGICGWRKAGQPVVAALWPGSAGRYSVH
jgi:hypothetical protein